MDENKHFSPLAADIEKESSDFELEETKNIARDETEDKEEDKNVSKSVYVYKSVPELVEAAKEMMTEERLPHIQNLSGIHCIDGEKNFIEYRKPKGSMVFADEGGAWKTPSTSYYVLEFNEKFPYGSKIQYNLKWDRNLKVVYDKKTKETVAGQFCAIKQLSYVNKSNNNFTKRVTTFQTAPKEFYNICYKNLYEYR